MKTYRYTDATKAVVHVIDADGVSRMSMLASTLPEDASILPFIPQPAEKPQVVSAFQAVAALDAAGLLASVEAMMANPATQKKSRLAWAHAQEFRRNSPTVRAMGQALGLDDAALDALFAAASQIEA